MEIKERSERNRTIVLSEEERTKFDGQLKKINGMLTVDEMKDTFFTEDIFRVITMFPENSVDLLVLDPPYNLDKDFGDMKFSQTNDQKYFEYLDSWFPLVLKLLKSTGSVYLCGDWKSTNSLYQIMSKYITVRNRITWQREKGRGAQKNWKNCTEDIWFGTKSNDYYFDVNAVKVKKKVIAPYKENGIPKDWEETEDGKFRMTYPSNFWDDITVPYWSMPENTDHPTQKPEKLIAKLILASCPKEGIVFDPFLGSGTTAVVAKKLGRHFSGIEMNPEYGCWALKRLENAIEGGQIQGYNEGIFLERNHKN